MGKVLINAGGGGGIDPDGLTAASGDVLVERKFGGSGSDEAQTGSMPDRGSPAHTLPINEVLNLPAGRYTGGRVTQNIPTMGAQTINPSASVQSVATSGKYMTGDVSVNQVSNLLSQYIKKGVWIGGVLGTFEGYEPEYFQLFWDGKNNDGFILDSGWSWSYPFFWANRANASFQTAKNYMTGHYNKLVVVCSFGSVHQGPKDCYIARSDNGDRLASVRMYEAQNLYYCVADLRDYMFVSKITISASLGVNIHRIVFEV